MSEARTRAAVSARSGGHCEMQVEIEELDGRKVRRYPERCPALAAEKSHRWGRGTGGPWSPANILDLCSECHRWLHASPQRARAGKWALLSESDAAAVPVWLPDPFPAWWFLDDNPPDRGEHVLRLAAHGPRPNVELRRVAPATWAV